ncbi:MAG: metallophosphoesterase family protein, partial [Candidatus Marinimicrobia bacterium]|nr:metallophosphoesterase family protein [Candidatus Neomarinimicrobiota bacterium]
MKYRKMLITPFCLCVSLGILQAATNPVRVALIGDPHYNSVTEVEPLSSMIIDDIQNNLAFPEVDFVINLGDLTHYGSAEDWELAKADWNDLLIPWMFTFGNHETANHL